eukprot:1151905-Pelagomonas_calceolata.AAC.6
MPQQFATYNIFALVAPFKILSGAGSMIFVKAGSGADAPALAVQALGPPVDIVNLVPICCAHVDASASALAVESSDLKLTE